MKFRLLKKTTLEDMSTGFLKRTLIVQEITSRIGKWNIIGLKMNTLLRKASQPTEWEKIFSKHTSDRALIYSLYKNSNSAPNSPKSSNQQISQQTVLKGKTNVYLRPFKSWPSREIQTKIALKFQILPSQNEYYQENNTSQHRCGVRGTLYLLLVGM